MMNSMENEWNRGVPFVTDNLSKFSNGVCSKFG